MNLLFDPWIPVEAADGPRRISPLDLTDKDNPPLRILSPRADMDDALLQFLVAVVQSMWPPSSLDDWEDHLTSPPARDELSKCLEKHRSAFDFDGGEASAFEDFDRLADAKEVCIGALFIDEPGGNAVKNNTDLFIKRGSVESLCENCAAAALWTLQTMAPAGGAGHRTGLRGGGPLSIFVKPRSQATLWQTVWANVVEKSIFKGLGETKFPWVLPTRTSKGKSALCTPENTSWSDVYWAMPRRVRLVRKDQSARCGLCGSQGTVTVTGFRTANYGANYVGWIHPLSPYYRNPKGEMLPQHPQPGGFTYRHWLPWVVAHPDQKTQPATVVARYVSRMEDLEVPRDINVIASGWDMDNMKPRCWYQASFPVWTLPKSIDYEEFHRVVQTWVEVASSVASDLRGAIKRALKADKADRSYIQLWIDRLWDETEPSFFQFVRQLGDGDEADLSEQWLRDLNRCCLHLYERAVNFDDLSDQNDPANVVRERKQLRIFLNSKRRRASLGLPAKQTRRD